MLGLYVHIPFCIRKCPYCDFYSVADLSAAESYTACILQKMDEYAAKISQKADTLYFGGGTPSLMKAEYISNIVDRAAKNFCLTADAEITMEVNPATANYEYLHDIRAAGVNRISIGMQSSNDNELRLLGRLHTSSDTVNTVDAARKAGFDNISLDLMLGIPEQSKASLSASIEQCKDLDADHISAYMLKIEQGTAFSKKLPGKIADDEQLADYYKATCNELNRYGYEQYEISNFCKNGKLSRHNMKYWQLDEYLGLGPGAHSFVGGRRFYFDRDIIGFLTAPTEIDDGRGGDEDEFIMLAMRLSRGIVFEEYKNRYGHDISPAMMNRLKTLVKNGLGIMDSGHFRLNIDGMLISNSAIAFVLG